MFDKGYSVQYRCNIIQYKTIQQYRAIQHTHTSGFSSSQHMTPFSCQKTLQRPRTVTQLTPREPSLTAQHTAAQLSPATLSNKERNLKGVSLRGYHSLSLLQPYFCAVYCKPVLWQVLSQTNYYYARCKLSID